MIHKVVERKIIETNLHVRKNLCRKKFWGKFEVL